MWYSILCCDSLVQEFCKIYRQFLPFGNPNKFASFVFRVYDRNKDGTIEFRQFIKALSVTTRGSTEEKLLCELCVYAAGGLALATFAM